MDIQSQNTDIICDLIAGSIAGVINVSSSQPFDTIKVRMQMVTSNKSMFQTALTMLTKEGPLSFYKGIIPPLCMSLPVSSTLFAGYEFYMRELEVNREEKQIKHWVLAGAFAGFLQSFVIAPTELFKNIFQMQFEYLPKKYSTILGCSRQFIIEEGPLKLFKGIQATILRDIPQYAMYFSAFEYVKYMIMASSWEKTELSLLEQFTAGCVAGLTCIAVSYPQDAMKTRIQCESVLLPQERNYKSKYFDGGVSDCAKSIYREQGLRGFYHGFNSCAIYYIVSCSTQLVAYEQAKLFLNNYVKH